MVAKGIPGKLGNDPMVLVQVVTMVSKYEIRLKSYPNGLKEFLDAFPFVREKTVSEIPDNDLGAASSSKE